MFKIPRDDLATMEVETAKGSVHEEISSRKRREMCGDDIDDVTVLGRVRPVALAPSHKNGREKRSKFVGKFTPLTVIRSTEDEKPSAMSVDPKPLAAQKPMFFVESRPNQKSAPAKFFSKTLDRSGADRDDGASSNFDKMLEQLESLNVSRSSSAPLPTRQPVEEPSIFTGKPKPAIKPTFRRS